MNILFITVNSPPLFSGRAKQAHELSIALTQVDYKIDIISLDQSNNCINGNCLHRLKYEDKLKSLIKILSLSLHYDVVHIHGLNYSLLLAPLLKLINKKVVLHMSSLGYDDPITMNKSNLLRFLLKFVDFHIVQKKSLEIDNKTRFIPNLLSIKTKKSSRTCVNSYIDILVSGVICQRKRQVEILYWLKKLSNNYVRVHFAGSFVNNYNEFEKDYVNEFNCLASELENCRVYGQLEKNELQALMTKSHYFFAISKQEGLSNSYIECLSSNLIPISFMNNVDELFDVMGIGNNILLIDDMDCLNYDFMKTKILNEEYDFSEKALEFFSKDSVINHLNRIYKA
ncbi:hypothetical protein AB6D73_17105 [Vibrio splendidus]